MRLGTLAIMAIALACAPMMVRAADKPAPGSAAAAAAPTKAAPLPQAQGSAIAGLGFGDKPYALPDDGTYTNTMNKIAHEAQRRCGAVEAFGWEIQPDDQRRVDKLTDSLQGALRQAKFIIKPLKPTQVSTDTVVYAADRADRHLLVLQSLSAPTNRDQLAQMVLLICDTATR